MFQQNNPDQSPVKNPPALLTWRHVGFHGRARATPPHPPPHWSSSSSSRYLSVARGASISRNQSASTARGKVSVVLSPPPPLVVFFLALSLCRGTSVARGASILRSRAGVCHGERLPKLIRNAEKQIKIPVMAVVGPKELEMRSVTVRSRFGGEAGTMKLDDFLSRIKDAIERRSSF
ncbi:hypothetical protein Scep_024618 [Stephania cephalantha]|uniref:Anticodon-binding domain-containing protein n=1 Tax=Stephania cephalantha TaxID=152367 RepID=A0AAP0HTV1_9MAGN